MSGCRFISSTEPRVISGRHASPCVCDDREIGCLPCLEQHCVCCGKAHAKAACVECLEAARADLAAIWTLAASLPAEAVEKGVRSEAMVLSGPAADPEAWQNYAMSAVRGRLCKCIQRRQLCPSLWGKTCPDAAYVDDNRDEQHPLFVLGGWEQIWRDYLDHHTEAPVTLHGAYSYIDLQIAYMAEQIEPAFDELAKELKGCRSYLENVLQEGVREQRSQVPCVDCETRLIKVYAEKEPDDWWSCPRCQRTYTEQEYARAQHFHSETERADRFVKVSVALGMIDRPEQTLRTWMATGKVKTEKEPKTGALLVWWPDVRDLHRDTPTRKRRTA